MGDSDSHRNIDQDYFAIIRRRSTRPRLANFTDERPSRKERLAAGKQLRKAVPRRAHATYRAPDDRANPVDILKAQDVARVRKLVPVRYARMLASPFAFLRGSAAIMAADLSHTPITGVDVAACGDVHVSNFGMFASAERNLIFAINDFDEVHPGPWEWDLKRLVTSAAVAAHFLGGDAVDAERMARAAVSSYRRHMRRYAGLGFLAVWYDRIDQSTILRAVSPNLRRDAARLMAKARTKGHQRTLGKLTEEVDGRPRIIEDVPLIVRETHLEDGTQVDRAVDAMLQSYIHSIPDDRRRLLSRYRLVDVARKVVGVGSVGTSCWVVLLEGLDANDPLFLQVKEARRSVLAPYVRARLPFPNQGRRVVIGQRLTQGSPDIFLGWGSEDGRHFYVRQLADMKGAMELIEGDRKRLDGFAEYCQLCGWALALAHAKSGDAATIAGYCGTSDVLDEALAQFAKAYVAQNERDYDALVRAKRQRRARDSAALGLR